MTHFDFPRGYAPHRSSSATRRQLIRLGLGAAAGIAGVSRGATGALYETAAQSLAAQPSVALGAYIPLALDDPAVLQDFAAAIGRDLDFVVWYEGWSNGDFGDGARAYLETMDQWNLTPVIAWDPMEQDGPPIDQPLYALANIIRGDFDPYIDSWAQGLAAYGKPVFLNFAHEMNGNWYPWGIGVNGNQPGEFVQAWRHVHDRFSALGASNVRWVWTPNEMYADVPATVEEVYPGDDYVDWFGMNGFNWGAAIRWGSCDCQSAWRTFNEVFSTTYDRLVSLAPKPIMIGETASAERGGDKAAWITDALLVQLPEHYPQIRAVAWFNKVATGLDTVEPGVVEATTEVDWRVTSSTAALEAFAEAVNTPYYQGSLLTSGMLDSA